MIIYATNAGMNIDTQDLLRLDKDYIWHPYTSLLNPPPVFPVASASGVRIRLTDGRELIDGMSSWWCAIHGYNHPVLNAAIENQLQAMAHVMFGGFTHGPAVALAEATEPSLADIVTSLTSLPAVLPTSTLGWK